MRTTRSRLALVAMALTLALAGAACSSDDDTAAPSDDSGTEAPSGSACGSVPGEGAGSFADFASQPAGTAVSRSQVLSTLSTAVGEAGLTETLDGEGPFTIFAPSNAAFGAVPAGDFDALLADKETLTSVLENHVVAGEYTTEEIIDAGTLDSLAGDTLTIEASGDSFTVDGAQVICGAIPVENGTVYVIDAVLQPGE